MQKFYPILLIALFSGVAFAQNVKFPAMNHLTDGDSFRVARLTPSEQEQVYKEIETITSDTPPSWDAELRVLRVSLGGLEEGLVLQGTQVLCGKTGNCQTFILRRQADKWISMLQEEAPIASGFGIGPDSSKGIKDFVVASNTSAESENYVVYKWDGKHYQASRCYAVSKSETKSVPCK